MDHHSIIPELLDRLGIEELLCRPALILHSPPVNIMIYHWVVSLDCGQKSPPPSSETVAVLPDDFIRTQWEREKVTTISLSTLPISTQPSSSKHV